MSPFKNILVLHSADPSVLQRAIALARAQMAHLTVVDVAKKLDGVSLPGRDGLPPVDIQELVIKELSRQLKKAIAAVKHEDLGIESKVLVGRTALEIIREVIRNKHDLVIMAAEGVGLKEQLFGSTSLRLMRACPCPVLVVKSGRCTKVLAAVDVEPDDETQAALNASVIELASSWAAHEQAEFHIVHAWTLYGESLLEGPAGLEPAEVRRIVEQEAANRRRLTETLAAKLQATNAKLHVVKGEASEVIPQLVKSQAIDMLVMGTVCRTGIAGFLIGNTAETILNQVNCSVLAVKPAGFESPITVDD